MASSLGHPPISLPLPLSRSCARGLTFPSPVKDDIHEKALDITPANRLQNEFANRIIEDLRFSKREI
jgi:hypothetical protein